MGQGGVVQRAVPSAIATGSAPISTTSACAIGSMAGSAVTPKLQSSSRVRSRLMPVKVMAGCSASGWPRRTDRVQDSDAETPRGVGHELAGLPGPELRESLHEGAEGVVRDRQQHQFGALHDVLHLEDGDAGQQCFGTVAAGVRHGGDPDDGMFRGAQCGPRTAPTLPAPMIPTPRRPGLAMLRPFLWCGFEG